jgi:twitching motility protein PilI
MTMERKPLQILLEMESRSKLNAAALPQQIDVRTTWDGVGFRVGDYQLVAPMEQISETLGYPSLTRVPGTKRWVKGVANIRGNLLPILDMNDFITGNPINIQRHSRIMVVHYHGISAGLLVDESLGMQHFFDEERGREAPNLDININRYLTDTYRQGNELWWVIDLYQMVESSEFLQVAA